MAIERFVSVSYETVLASLSPSLNLNITGDVWPLQLKDFNQSISFENGGDLVSISQLLADPNLYHKQIVTVRGTVTQPELHLDDSGLFIRFVFVLKEKETSLIVFGHHDRTQGNLQIEMNENVEVVGIFWKERTANDHHFQNNLEAFTVTRFPPYQPESA